MREKNRKPIASIKKLPQFTTMNVIDGQAGLISYFSLIFYSLTIDNILNIVVVLLILAGVSISMLTGENGIITQAQNAKEQSEIGEEKEAISVAYSGAKIKKEGKEVKEIEIKNRIRNISYELLELAYMANITKYDKNKYIEEIIAKVKVLDFLLNLCYDKQIINSKRYVKFGEKMDDILKYSIGWQKSINENEKNRA